MQSLHENGSERNESTPCNRSFCDNSNHVETKGIEIHIVIKTRPWMKFLAFTAQIPRGHSQGPKDPDAALGSMNLLA